MIDLNDLRARPDAYQDAARKKRIAVDIPAFLALDAKRRELLPLVESMRARRNAVSKAVPSMAGSEKQRAIAEMRELASELKQREDELAAVDREWEALQLLLPSIPLPQVPVGKDDTENREVRKWGRLPEFDFPPKDHVTLGQALDIIDIPRGVKIAGSWSYFLKGDAVRLELAVLRFTLDHLIRKGFTPFAPPLLASWEAMMGTSYFPGGEEQAYAVGARPDRDGPMEADRAESWLMSHPWSSLMPRPPLARGASRAARPAQATARRCMPWPVA
jgi:seryl-tRNA synthetase